MNDTITTTTERCAGCGRTLKYPYTGSWLDKDAWCTDCGGYAAVMSRVVGKPSVSLTAEDWDLVLRIVTKVQEQDTSNDDLRRIRHSIDKQIDWTRQ